MQSTSTKSETDYLNNLFQSIADCKDCSLHEQAKQTVPGIFVGDRSHTNIMFVGEGPGADEDKEGLPFIGRAGQLLQKTLLGLGLTDNIYISNIVKHRPPGNRKPTMEEMSTCANKALIRELLHIEPQVVVCLGRTPAEYFMNLSSVEKKGSLRGFQFDIKRDDGWTAPVLCTWHPAYILRTPAKYDELKEDILKATQIKKGEV